MTLEEARQHIGHRVAYANRVCRSCNRRGVLVSVDFGWNNASVRVEWDGGAREVLKPGYLVLTDGGN